MNQALQKQENKDSTIVQVGHTEAKKRKYNNSYFLNIRSKHFINNAFILWVLYELSNPKNEPNRMEE